jgi:prevent-host-death family protein
MPKTVTLRDANQNFAKLIREVQGGAEFVITRRGEPVARLSPASAKRVLTPEQEKIHRQMMRGLAKGWPLGGETFDRGPLYDD